VLDVSTPFVATASDNFSEQENEAEYNQESAKEREVCLDVLKFISIISKSSLGLTSGILLLPEFD